MEIICPRIDGYYSPTFNSLGSPCTPSSLSSFSSPSPTAFFPSYSPRTHSSESPSPSSPKRFYKYPKSKHSRSWSPPLSLSPPRSQRHAPISPLSSSSHTPATRTNRKEEPSPPSLSLVKSSEKKSSTDGEREEKERERGESKKGKRGKRDDGGFLLRVPKSIILSDFGNRGEIFCSILTSFVQLLQVRKKKCFFDFSFSFFF